VASAEQGAVGGEERGADGDAAFAEALAGFVKRDLEHGAALIRVGRGGIEGVFLVVEAHWWWLIGCGSSRASFQASDLDPKWE
jgi:hypothetical protein